MKILVIEDEHKIANSIKKGLEQEHFVVDLCYLGQDGLDLILNVKKTYDLIILDLMLPDISGIEICKTLRRKLIQFPILMLTAKGQTSDKVEGLDAGADDYLTKPFSFEELLARIRALSRRPISTIDSILRLADLQLNTKTFTATRQNQEIKLSSKEFSLLSYLMKNSKRVFTKEQLIDYVWDYDAEVLPNTVEVYIKNLRNKIDEPFPQSKPLIHTLRGFGYKMDE